MPKATPTIRPRVLVIEDEPPLLEAFVELLEAEFKVESAPDVASAERRMRGAPFDVIVCDHMLPGELGLEFLTRLSTEQPYAARILMTGYINPELILRSTTLAGLSACLLKPIKADDLLRAVRDAAKKPRGRLDGSSS